MYVRTLDEQRTHEFMIMQFVAHTSHAAILSTHVKYEIYSIRYTYQNAQLIMNYFCNKKMHRTKLMNGYE